MLNESSMYEEAVHRNDKRQKRPDDEPQAYAGADENSSSDDEVRAYGIKWCANDGKNGTR